MSRTCPIPRLEYCHPALKTPRVVPTMPPLPAQREVPTSGDTGKETKASCQRHGRCSEASPADLYSTIKPASPSSPLNIWLGMNNSCKGCTANERLSQFLFCNFLSNPADAFEVPAENTRVCYYSLQLSGLIQTQRRQSVSSELCTMSLVHH